MQPEPGKQSTQHMDRATIRPPVSSDGMPVHRLIDRCKPLDPNSVYCNLLQCLHFADTCALAEQNGETVGFVSAYIPPARPDTLFVWQIAVDDVARGQGLAKRLLKEILARPACKAVRYLECTITEDNVASWGVFLSLAKELDADEQRLPMFDKEKHFFGEHDSEVLLRIGPFENRLQNNSSNSKSAA